MSRKFIFAGIAVILLTIFASSCACQPCASTERSQFPAAKLLFTGPSVIYSINWSVPDMLIIESIYMDGKSHPPYTGNISSGEVSPLTIKGRTISGFSPTISSDGKYLALDSGRGITRIISIKEKYADDTRLRYTASSLAWSHDSNYLAFTNGGEIYIYDLQKEQMKMKFDPQLPNLRRPLCCSLAWSADDQKMAVALEQGKKNSTDEWSDIYVLNLKNDQFIQVTNTPDESEGSPVWFPKEDILMFVSPAVEGDLVLARGDGLCQMKIPELQGINSPV